MSEHWYLLTVVIGLGLTAMAIRNVERYWRQHLKLALYLVALVACALGGSLVAHAADGYHWPAGAVVGAGIVELAPTISLAVKAVARKHLGKVFDRFAPDREPGYGADDGNDT